MFGHVLLTIMLAVVWCFLLEDFRVATFVFGYALATGVVFVLRRLMGETVAFRKWGVALKLIVVFLYELVVANLQVAWLIWQPRMKVQPALIRIPIELEKDISIVLLANMISLTPGTVTMDVAEDRKSLLVHCLNVDNIEETKRVIKDIFERPLRELEQ